MRIAISGSHRVGKTSLAEAVSAALPDHELFPEPYHALEDDGHEFGEMPSVEDFVLQLERSLEMLEQSGPRAIFDRCPLDIVAYLETHAESYAFDPDDWKARIGEAMASLSLLVVVPIETPDRVTLPPNERRFRQKVDEHLVDIVMDGRLTDGIEVVHVAGSLERRLAQVLQLIERRPHGNDA